MMTNSERERIDWSPLKSIAIFLAGVLFTTATNFIAERWGGEGIAIAAAALFGAALLGRIAMTLRRRPEPA